MTPGSSGSRAFNFSSYLTGTLDGQPGWVQAWINFWINVVNVDPHVFAHLVAIGETAVAIGLLLGVFSNLTYVVGILVSVVIWTTAESFGGPYTPGSTDIGAAIIYVLVFIGLYLSQSGLIYGFDRWLTRKLGSRFAFLLSGPLPDEQHSRNRIAHLRHRAPSSAIERDLAPVPQRYLWGLALIISPTTTTFYHDLLVAPFAFVMRL